MLVIFLGDIFFFCKSEKYSRDDDESVDQTVYCGIHVTSPVFLQSAGANSAIATADH